MEKQNHISTGVEGESAAANFLRRKGMRIISQNYRADGCEIDIIARDGDKTLVFAEVKTRSSNRYGNPEESVSKAKQINMVRAAEIFVEEKGWKHEIRFDVIAVIPHPQGTFSIHHICDAFAPGEDE